MLIDVANVLGSRPDGWWRDRAAASARLIDRFATLVGTVVIDPDGRPSRVDRLIAVLEGTARAARPTSTGGVEVVDADGDGDSTIAALAREFPAETGLLVVTADRGLRQRLPPEATATGPDWLNRLIGR